MKVSNQKTAIETGETYYLEIQKPKKLKLKDKIVQSCFPLKNGNRSREQWGKEMLFFHYKSFNTFVFL